jgi:putative peptidoglycan lipid II flippase
MALEAYAAGLAGYAAILVLRPCFYALNLPKIPLRVSLIGIAINLALNFFNMQVLGLGHVGLALTTSAVAVINMGQLFFALRRRVDLGASAPWIGFLARCLIAAGVCAGLAIAAKVEAHHLGLPRIVGLGAGVALGVGGYFGAARLLGLSESHEAWLLIRRRIPFLPKPA